MRREFGLESAHQRPAETGGVHPSRLVPVILNQSPHELSWARLGLVPPRRRHPAAGPALINARDETIDRKPTFREAFRHRRCIIPTDGFFLSHRGGDGRLRTYRISAASGDPLPFAGIWEVWRSPEGAAIRSCSTVTVPANSAIAPIHDRMPAILSEAEQRVWLGNGEDVRELRAVLHPCRPELLKVEEVRRSESDPRLELPFRF